MKHFAYHLLLVVFVVAGCIPKNACEAIIDTETVNATLWNDNSLRVDISGSWSNDAQLQVEFWKMESPNIRQISNTKNDGMMTLINLVADTDYGYQLIVNDTCKIQNERFRFTTGSLPTVLNEISAEQDSSSAFNGYVLLHQGIDIENHYLVILNNLGQVVWYQWMKGNSGPFYWRNNQTISTLLGEEGLVEIDLLGNVLFELNLGEKGFQKNMHHELRYLDNKKILSLTREIKLLDQEEKKKWGVDTIKSDGFVVLDSLGQRIWDWNMFQDNASIPAHFDAEHADDWGHANAVRPDGKGGYLISFKKFSQIWNIDGQTGKVRWKLGKNGDFELNEGSVFTEQHAPHINDLGHLMIFDNGGRRAITRAISFAINDEDLTVEKQLDVALPTRFFTHKRGNVLLIDEQSKLLFCSTVTRNIIATNLNGDVGQVISLNVPTYRVEYIPKFECHPVLVDCDLN